MSAPHSSGRMRNGVATVLSMISGTPTSCATARDGLDVEHVVLGVRDRLAEEQLRVRLHRGPPGLRVVGVLDERRRDAQLRQRVVQQVVGAAVQARARHDVVAGLGDVEERERLRRLAAGHQQGGDAALEGSDAVLDHGLGRVHDAGVDVAELLEPEQVRGVRGVVERVRRGLVDRQGAGVGRAVRRLAGVDLLRLEGPGVAHGISLGGRAVAAGLGMRKGVSDQGYARTPAQGRHGRSTSEPGVRCDVASGDGGQRFVIRQQQHM